MLWKILTFVCAFIAYLAAVHPDWLTVLLPKYYDAYFVRAMYSRDGVNKGTKRVPLLTQMIPSNITLDNLKDIFNPTGYPVLVKNVMNVDQDLVVDILVKGNAGKKMRMFSYEAWKTPHISPSCGMFRQSEQAAFDDYAKGHLYTNVSDNHSYMYAGFESITDAETVETITGVDIKHLADYRQNNLFTSNFPREILTAPMHCAPIDSLSLQLIGTKTWFFVSPENLAELQNIPMPTCFNLPMTDDELLAKLKNVYVVKQGPGDALYFGPHWCHAVSTAEGPNLMLNLRYNNLKLVKEGPKSLWFKLMIRYFTRKMQGLPQDNALLFPLIYDDLNQYYHDCGPSEAFNSIFEMAKKMV